jgi:DNA-directed RNA polymerase subunit RPC12/RpoP
MKKRLTFKCWNCSRTYTLQREITNEQVLTVACPYCGEDGVVDLNPFRNTITTVMRGTEDKEQDLGQALDLPEVLPTHKPQ